MTEKPPGLIARFVAWFLGLFFGALKQQGRVELEQEMKDAADAQREDFDRIANDDRSPGDAISKLRQRAKARDGGLP